MKKSATLIITRLECTETTKETKHDEVVLYLAYGSEAGWHPSEEGRYIFERNGGTQSINLEIHDIENLDWVDLKLIECDSKDPHAPKNEIIGWQTLYRDDVYKAYDWENLPDGALPPEEKSIRFDRNTPGSEINAGVYYIYYRVVTNPIPTVRVLGLRCEQQSAGYNQKAVEAILSVAEEATQAAGKVLKKSKRPKTKLMGEAFAAASKILKGVEAIVDWIGRIIEGKYDEIYMNRIYSSRGLNGAFFPPSDNEDFFQIKSEEEVYFEEKYGRYFRFPLDNGPVTLEFKEYDKVKGDVNVGSLTIDPADIAANSNSGIEADTMTGSTAIMDGPAVVELADTYGKRDGEGALYHICYSVGYEDWNKDATTDAQGDPDDLES